MSTPRVIRFDPAPTAAPEIDHPRPERREVGDPERRTWVLYDNAAEGLATRVADSTREITKLRSEVILCAPDSLPNDGRVIEDARRHT